MSEVISIGADRADLLRDECPVAWSESHGLGGGVIGDQWIVRETDSNGFGAESAVEGVGNTPFSILGREHDEL